MTNFEPVSSTSGDGAPTPATFRGFAGPHYTQVPDDLFDELLSLLSGAELKVLLYIIRRTFGFKKTSEAISLQQIRHGITTRDGRVLDRGTGLSLSATQSAIKGLIAKGVLLTLRNRSTERGDEATTYRLHLRAHTVEGPDAGRDEPPPTPHTSAEAEHPPLPHDVPHSALTHPTMPQPVTDSRPGEIPKSGKGGYRFAVSQETGSQQTAVKLRNSKAARPQENGETQSGEATPTVSLPETAPAGTNAARAEIHPAPWSQTQPRGKSHPQDLRVLLATRSLPTMPRADGRPVPTTWSGRNNAAGTVAPPPRPASAPSVAQPANAHHGRIRPTPAIAVAVTEVSQDFGDLGHLAANSTQAMRLWQQSGRGEMSFVSVLYEARSITKQQPRIASRIAYYWIVVRDLLGFLADGDPPAHHRHTK